MPSYLIPQCNHTLGDARTIGDIIASVHTIKARTTVREGGMAALAFRTDKVIPVEDLMALGLSGPINEGEAEKIFGSK